MWDILKALEDGDLERCVGRGLPFNRFLSFEALGGSLTSDQHVSSFDREEGVLIFFTFRAFSI
ncbi:hypothetical protein Syun_019076 [Stephania yunnanensis]|uniref:Uncharacterized protein n=1 Tax=Stephania yunnanensis TaxID=152371 RepID=A0AAP0ITK2_9MAGN